MSEENGKAPEIMVGPLLKLREPFPAASVGKLPRVTKKEGEKSRCAECGGWLPPHIHLDYVGHAQVTDRLLSVDPLWQWEPLALNERGLPEMGQGVGGELTLWVRLTVCGITRLGVGSVAKGAFEAEKQLISDAIRNAAMRFGVALDLWAKEELESSLAPAGIDTSTGEITGGGTTEAEKPVEVAGGRSAQPAMSSGSKPDGQHVPPASTRRPPPGRSKQEKGERSQESASSPAASDDATSQAGGVDRPAGSPPDSMTAAQNRMLHAMLNGAGITGDDDRHRYATETLGRPVESYSGLSKTDASKLIDALKVKETI